MASVRSAIADYEAGQLADKAEVPPERDSLLAIRHWRDENRNAAERGLLTGQEERHWRDVDRVLVELDSVTAELTELEDRAPRDR